MVRNKKKWGIYYNDQIAIPIKYDEISSNIINNNCNEFYFIAKKKSKWGLLDTIGNKVIGFKYNEITHPVLIKKRRASCFQIKNGIVVKKNDYYGIISIKDSLLLDFKCDSFEYDVRNRQYIYYED